MAKYVQLTPDLARAALEKGLARDLLVALEYVALAERLDAPYGEVKRAFAKLEAAGVSLLLDDLIGTLLAGRARTNRKRSKSDGIDDIRHGTKGPGTNIKRREEEGKTEKKEEQKEEGCDSSVPDEFHVALAAELERARRNAGVKL